MSIPTPSLQAFIEPAPTCSQMTRLASVLEIFSQNQCDRVVVVNEGQSPLGLLYLRRLMPHLMAGFVSAAPHPPSGSDRSSLLPSTPLDLQQPISALQTPGISVSPSEPPLVEPVEIFSAHLSLSQFWPQLQLQLENPSPARDWALVDGAGKFLGILDSQRLLTFLANNWQPEGAIAPQPDEAPENLHLQTDSSQFNSKRDRSSLLKTLHPLIELLKRLPLPLRLQTTTGKVLIRNLAWCLQFPPISYTGEDEMLVTERRKNSTVYNRENSAPPPQNNLADWRYIDSVPDNSQGACPLPNGSEKVWQFVKIPLDMALLQSPSQNPVYSPPVNPKIETNSEILQPEKSGSSSVNADPNTSLSSGSTVQPGKGNKKVVFETERLEAGDSLRRSSRAYAPGYANDSRAQAGQNQQPDVSSAAPGEQPTASSPGDPSDFTVNSEETLWLMLAQDVTEQHQVAQELAAKNADLVQLNRLKDEFLACISHELKTPLTAVLGLSSLLKDRAIGPLNERQARYAKLIYQSGRHLMTVVNDILDLTRIETGQLELIIEPVNVLNACDRAYKQAQQNQPSSETPPTNEKATGDSTEDDEATETQFTLEIESDIQTLIADEMRLRQMLVNLLSNALKFTSPGGAIGLKVSRWEGWIAFTVWDTGIGIPDSKQHLIFQKFQQLENPLTRRFEGAGLGLVLTQRLARLHGGDVSFISQEGKGSQFTVLLPPCPPQRGAILPESVPHQHRLVLIVETVPRFIDELSQQLTDLGYRVLVARTGTEAVEKARRFSPETIFINPVLPVLSGWDVLTLLKSDETTHHVPIIITATQAEKDLALQNGADGFLSLPVQPSALRQKLERSTERSPSSVVKPIVLRLNASPHKDESPDLAIAEDRHRSEISELMTDLNTLLHQHNYRVLEADELDQAALLARVWQPNVVLLINAGALFDPVAYLTHLSQHESLASVPIVTLEQEIARCADRVPGLSVFSGVWTAGVKSAPSALLQLLQVAAGMSWKPSILAVDISNLPDFSVPPSFSSHPSEVSLGRDRSHSESLPPLIQYMQTAGFRAIIGRSWTEVLRLIENQSIDLLLICGRPAMPPPALLEALVSLGRLATKPPILVLAVASDSHLAADRDRNAQVVDESARKSGLNDELKPLDSPQPSTFGDRVSLLDGVLRSIATKVASADLSMAALLEEITRILSRKN